MFDKEVHFDLGAGKAYSRLVMDDRVRTPILERNQAIRNESPLKKLEWAQWELCIPLIDYEVFKAKYPDIFDGPAQDRKAALTKFLNSQESLPYRVRA